MSLMECLEKANLPKNQTVLDNFIRAHKIINNPFYNVILCSISGGSDSDIMLDIISKVDEQNKVKYVWFDTGLEYQATKDHLLYLEQKYNIKIERERAIKPIPTTCREYGQPFCSKMVSKNIQALQARNFKFEDKPYEELVKEYCDIVSSDTSHAECIDGVWYKGCLRALKWWCNRFGDLGNDKKGNRISHFNINRNTWLKEFMIQNPPDFKISSECCHWAKKEVSNQLIKRYNCDLMIIGLRKAEGGARSTIYKNCFSENDTGMCDFYRPIFWYLDSDKVDYEKSCNIIHSDCYKIWGFKRTGCCCCPYSGRNLYMELETTKKYEPKLYKAVNNVFKDSYDYTMKYHKFQKDMKQKERGIRNLF